MPRPVALLFLTLALTGQPLRQAEAAGDFARSLAHLLAACDTIEVPDGGVGDDPGVAVMKAETGYAAASAWFPLLGDLWASDHSLFASFVFALPSPGLFTSRGRQERVAWLPTRGSRCQAWLQLFLF